MEFICGKKPAKVLEAVKETVAYAKSKCKDVEFSAQDATRSEMPFLCQVIEAAIENGATTIDICDTAGVMFPEEFKNFIEEIKANVPAMENVVISAIANYGYHFVKWNDNNTENPRTISVTKEEDVNSLNFKINIK